MEGYNQRSAARSNQWNVDAKIVLGEEEFLEIEISDISSGGLMFQTETAHGVGDVLTVDLRMKSFKFNHHFQAKIVIKSDRGLQDGLYTYGAKFQEISESDRIRLDVLVNSDNPLLRVTF